jgi:ABC-type transporter Mla subunit MlaD
VRWLTNRGHLDDVPHPDDARSRLISLSGDGQKVTARAASILSEILPLLNDALDEGQDAIRAKLSELDDGLRRLVDAAPRPYAVPGAGQTPDRPTISYPGPRLSPVQTDEVRDFIDWLRTRDRTRPGEPPTVTADFARLTHV